MEKKLKPEMSWLRGMMPFSNSGFESRDRHGLPAAMSLLTLEPDETARAYLTRAFAAPRLLGVPALGAASANGEVIEVYGPSRSGKTELLLHVSCWWALSASRGRGHSGGRGGFRGGRTHTKWS